MKVSGTSVILVLLFFTTVAAQPSLKLPLPQHPNVLMKNPIKNKNANAGLEQYKEQPLNVDIKKVNDNVNAVIRNQQDLANFMSKMFEALFTNQEERFSYDLENGFGLLEDLDYIIKMVEQIPGNKG